MTSPFDLLKASLLELLYELRDASVTLIVGGGYGLHLKQQRLKVEGLKPLIEPVPEERSTNDLDLFLRTEVLVDLEQAKAVLKAVHRLGYQAVEERENFQFVRKIVQPGSNQERVVKLDFLTKYTEDASERRALEFQNVRARNKGHGGIHAYRTDEAVAVEDEAIPLVLAGVRTNGKPFQATVYLPQAYAYVTLKLFAFRDWEANKRNIGHSRKHAFDLYRAIAMMTRDESDIADNLSQKYRQEPITSEAAAIVSEYFSDVDAFGMLRLREHAGPQAQLDVPQFLLTLRELFQVR